MSKSKRKHEEPEGSANELFTRLQGAVQRYINCHHTTTGMAIDAAVLHLQYTLARSFDNIKNIEPTDVFKNDVSKQLNKVVDDIIEKYGMG